MIGMTKVQLEQGFRLVAFLCSLSADLNARFPMNPLRGTGEELEKAHQ